MNDQRKINPSETYVFDEDELAELDDTSFTSIVKGLTESVDNEDDSEQSD